MTGDSGIVDQSHLRAQKLRPAAFIFVYINISDSTQNYGEKWQNKMHAIEMGK
jgi:hypothetical protein